jgi:cysteine desulfurase
LKTIKGKLKSQIPNNKQVLGFKNMKRIYFDNAATTPLDPQVLQAMMPFLKEKYGNASSLHSFGQETRRAVDVAREKVANVLGCKEKEVIFTGTNTLSDNLAIRGVAKALKDKGDHIITSSIEHHAVLDTCKALEKEGFRVTYLPVDKYGLVDPLDVEKAITKSTILITIMYANNEVGTIEPIAEIGRIAQKKGAVFHTDAATVVGYLDINVGRLNIDMMTFGAHKFFGPKGVGVLYKKSGVKIEPISTGGSHEWGLWPGTEDVPGIVGLGKAIEMVEAEKKRTVRKVTALRDRLIRGVLESIKDVVLTGHPTERLPDIASFCVKRAEGEAMLLLLDEAGIAVSSGSACTSGILKPSHVLLAIGISPEAAHGSLRISLSKYNTTKEVDYFLEVFPQIVSRLRQMSPMGFAKR